MDEAQEEQHSLGAAIALTVAGIAVVSVGGELVAQGASRIVDTLHVPALLMGMVVAPAIIELEEVIRQAVPTKEGRPDVSAGNLVGTLLYFVLFNLGLIALLTPVRVDPLVRQLDWPFLIAVTWLATLFLWRGRVGRSAGAGAPRGLRRLYSCACPRALRVTCAGWPALLGTACSAPLTGADAAGGRPARGVRRRWLGCPVGAEAFLGPGR